MQLCATCGQPITERVVEGRKLIAQLHTGPYTLPNTGRYVTVMLRKCGCGEQVEHRYENICFANSQSSHY